MRHGVSALVDMTIDCDSGILQLHWPADAYPLFGDQIYEDMSLMQAWLSVSKSAIIGILSTVRNRILNFALEIEATNPDAGEATPNEAPIPEERVSQIFNNYIYGSVGSVASGHGITQNTEQNIKSGDFDSLASFLRDAGFTDSDIGELREAVDAEETPGKEEFGPKVAGWIGKAVGKVAQGGTKISTSVASSVLSEALKNYYGL